MNRTAYHREYYWRTVQRRRRIAALNSRRRKMTISLNRASSDVAARWWQWLVLSVLVDL